jgi:hypothetical protein
MRGNFEAAAKHFQEALRIRRAVDPGDVTGIRNIEERLAAARRREVSRN